ncbi:MAG: RIP metalloprotease RseP [Alphaproteobacteria bacterium]|nr:RIP metalloprotease RseP [Alphaproteobacteria bacterium]
MNIMELVQVFGHNFFFYVVVFLIVLSVLVFVHEWGHYIVARLCRVRVDSFSIGFGKELFGWTDQKGTRWKVSMVPLGGYVKLFGDVDPASAGHTDQIEDGEEGESRPMTEDERKEAFFAKPVAQRAAIVFAGPAINYIFAFLIYAAVFMYYGQSVSPPIAAAVGVGTAAEKYGFQPQDRIVSIDGKVMESFNDVRREMLLALDVERHFVVERNGEKQDIFAKPDREEMTDNFGFKSSQGRLGIYDPSRGVDVSKITKVEGEEIKDRDVLIKALQDRMDTTYKMEVDLGPFKEELIVHPIAEMNKNMTNKGDEIYYNVLFLSSHTSREVIQLGPGEAVYRAARECYLVTRGILEGLGQMITGVRSATELGGIIRIGAITGEMAQHGMLVLIGLVALLSINLGFINLLPIPLLDGGHLLFYALEAIMGRPVSEQVQEYAFRFGLVFLIGIMAFANLNDLIQILRVGSG